MVKSFAAGANSLMVGSLISGTLETPGEIKGGKSSTEVLPPKLLKFLGEVIYLKEWPQKVRIR